MKYKHSKLHDFLKIPTDSDLFVKKCTFNPDSIAFEFVIQGDYFESRNFSVPLIQSDYHEDCKQAADALVDYFSKEGEQHDTVKCTY
jgi:hypothetical protein